MDNETIICFQIDSFIEKGSKMKKDELDYVYKAMKLDLSEVIENWDSSSEYPDPIPYCLINYQSNDANDDVKNWMDIAS